MQILHGKQPSFLDQRMPFSLMLGSLLVTTVSAAMVITAILDIRNAQNEFRIQTEQKAMLVASSVADLTANALYFRDIARLEEAADSVFRQRSLSFVRIVDKTGREFVKISDEGTRSELRIEQYAKELEGQVQIDGASIFVLRGDDAVVVQPIMAGGEILGIIEVGFEDSGLRSAVQAITYRRLWQTGVLIASSIIVSILFAGRLTRPIRQLEAGVERISGGDLSARVKPQGPRELRHLGEAFNSMVFRLEAALSEIERNQTELEQRVKDRTLELEVLSDVGRQFSTDLGADGALKPFAELILKLLPGTSIVVAELDDHGHQLNVKADFGDIPASLGNGQILAVQDSPWLEALGSEYPTVTKCGILGRISENEISDGDQAAGSTFLIVPLTSRGDAVGVLVFLRHGGSGFSLRDRNIGQSVASRISGVLAEERERRTLLEKAELRRIDNSRNEFLSNITHELKTPLTSVLAFTQILKKTVLRI